MTATTGTAQRVQEIVRRINELSAERTALYRGASEGWTPQQRERLKAIADELAALWEERRRAQAGQDDPNDVPVRHAA